ncbi:MAG: heme-binding protein [Geminicoccaceae bacterium]
MLASACSVFGVRSGLEQATYQVEETVGDEIEIRHYEPQIAVKTSSEKGPGEADSEAFRRLFRYISGANRGETKIAMTTPVETNRGGQEIAMTAPVSTERGENALEMMFFLPSGYTLATAPEPTDPDVRLVETPGRRMAVSRFTGFGGRDRVAAETEELLARLEASDWRVDGTPVTLFYDPPWTIPYLRRNEVAVSVTRE